MLKRLLLLLLSLIMVLGVVGCSNNEEPTPVETQEETPASESPAAEAPKEEKKAFRAAMTTNPQSLDEGYSTNTACRQVSVYIFETLFTFGEKYEVIPQLADSYTVSDDGLVYNIKLRQGIKFHDGSDFDADDVVATMERNKTTVMYNKNLDKIISVEKVNDYEVKFTLSEPIALLPMLAFPQRITMIPSEIAEANMGTELKGDNIIGTGPYKLVEWIPDSHVKLERFDDYLIDERYEGNNGIGGKRVATFEILYFLPVTEAESRIAGLETGEFDYAEAIPNTSYGRIKDNDDLQGIVRHRSSFLLEFNHKNWPTSDVNFRRALAYALDMEKVLTAATAGNKEFYRLNPSIYTPEQFYFTEVGSEDIYNKQDLDKVKELLKAADYNGEEIVYLVNKDYDWMYKGCLSLAEQWQAAGINVKLEFSDWPTQISKAQSMVGWHINQTGWSSRLDPTQVAASLKSGSTSGYGYASEEMDKYIAEVSLGKPEEERKLTWENIQRIIWEDMVVLKIGDYFELEAINNSVKGYKTFYITPRFWNLSIK